MRIINARLNSFDSSLLMLTVVDEQGFSFIVSVSAHLDADAARAEAISRATKERDQRAASERLAAALVAGA